MEEGGGVRLFGPGPGLARRRGEREEGRRLAPGDGDARRLEGGGGEAEGRRCFCCCCCCTGEGL